MTKAQIKKAIRSLGFDLTRFHPNASPDARLMAMLEAHKVNLVLDVGANIGQFGKMLREARYRGRIVSFEPLSTARIELISNSQGDSMWEVAPQAAIGGEDGNIEINIAKNSVSSSALDMLDAHSSAAPGSLYIGTELVPLRRLDSIASKYLQKDSTAFLKIDTQGYEDRVLSGATELLRSIIGLQLELSLVPLYSGQRMFDDLIEDLKIAGFEIWGISPAFVNPNTGRLLQVDATFFRA